MNLKDVEKLMKNFEDSNLMALELEIDGAKIKLSKRKEPDYILNNNETVISENKNEEIIKINTNKEPQKDFVEIKSPLVGTFYAAATPKDKPYVAVGDTVVKGQVLCIIEAMKIMNEIQATANGIIEKINFEDGKTVGFDDVLFLIRETNAK